MQGGIPMHTQPNYQFTSREEASSGRDYHVDNYILTYPDGTVTALQRQVPKRVGKTARGNKGTK